MLSGRPFGNLDIAGAGALPARQTSTVRRWNGTANDQVAHSMGRTEQECDAVGWDGQQEKAWATSDICVYAWAK
jgi:hypothetical protein